MGLRLCIMCAREGVRKWGPGHTPTHALEQESGQKQTAEGDVAAMLDPHCSCLTNSYSPLSAQPQCPFSGKLPQHPKITCCVART